jgi:N-formylglutamate deformylase
MMMSEAFELLQPSPEATVPLVCDSPHSGTHYPGDFRHCLPLDLLRRGEDTHVDALWSAAPASGATLLAARFPRTYIDVNRSLADLDADLFVEPWPNALQPSEKTRLGRGLVWRLLDPRTPIYDRHLSVAEVRARIENYYLPYHQALTTLVDAAMARFGAVWHLNLHSMPGDAYKRLGVTSNRPLADFVLGDRDGTTCDPAFVALVEEALRSFGYSVSRNDPYKGAALISRIGRPSQRSHSLQIEIRRPIYMDEATREPHTGFSQLQRDLTRLLGTLGAYVKDRSAAATEGLNQS